MSVHGWNYGESAVVNTYNKSISASVSETTFTAPIRIRSFKPSNTRSHGTHKSFHTTSELSKSNRIGSNLVSYDDSVVAYSDFNYNASNKISLSEKIFHLIKSSPENGWGFSEKSINHEISSDHSSVTGPPRIIKPENIVNTTRITNDAETIKQARRVKKSESFEKNVTGGGENKLSIHYNQSPYRNSQLPRNPADKNAKKKLKSVTTNPNDSIVKSTSSRDNKKLSKVSLLGLFEMTTHLGTRWEGRSELASAQLAVRHINERGLLPGYSLELITNDTQVTEIIDMKLNPLNQFLNLVCLVSLFLSYEF